MPDKDPEIGVCPEETSKARVWAAKLAQGVMCSYFDLYMACCLSFCTTIAVTGPGGQGYTGGTIPANENCWPNPSPCKDSTLSINYTSQQMGVNDSQALVSHDSAFGDEVPCCPTGDLSWEITEGAGELDMDSGQSVNYTAPEDNPDCANNPTIKVTDCCGREATLKLAVNASSGIASRNDVPTSLFHVNCDRDIYCTGTVMWCDKNKYDCNGVIVETTPDVSCMLDCDGIHDPLDHCQTTAPDCEIAFVDLRTPEQKAAGCCPAQLL